MRRSSRYVMTLVAFSLASVVNPGYFAGCTSSTSEPEKFEFGEAEMLELVDEANATGPFDIMSGSERYRLEVLFEQKAGEDQDDTAALQGAPLTSRAFACGNRTFMQSAAACITISEVPLRATLNLYRIDGDSEEQVVVDEVIDAQLMVFGKKLTGGQIMSGSYGIGAQMTQLSLTSSDGKTFKLSQFRIVAQDLLVEAAKN